MFDKDSRGALSLLQTERRVQELGIYISPNSVDSGPLSCIYIHHVKAPTALVFYNLLPATWENNPALPTLISAVCLRLSRNGSKHHACAQDGFPVLQLILPLVMLQITLPVNIFPFTRSQLCDTRDAHDGKRRTAYIYSA